MRKRLVFAALGLAVLLVTAGFVTTYSGTAPADDAKPDAEATECAQAVDPQLPLDGSTVRPVKDENLCPPTSSCGPGCHIVPGSCSGHSTGEDHCEDGTVQGFTCPHGETIYAYTCACAPNEPGGLCANERHSYGCE
jgi:hypothetical protein